MGYNTYKPATLTERGRQMKKLGLFIIVGLLSMTIPQMNANTFTVQAATIKKVTGIKKNRVKDGSYFYSKKKYYDGCYRKISWKKIKKVQVNYWRIHAVSEGITCHMKEMLCDK